MRRLSPLYLCKYVFNEVKAENDILKGTNVLAEGYQ